MIVRQSVEVTLNRQNWTQSLNNNGIFKEGDSNTKMYRMPQTQKPSLSFSITILVFLLFSKNIDFGKIILTRAWHC